MGVDISGTLGYCNMSSGDMVNPDPKNSGNTQALFGKDIVSIKDLSNSEINCILDRAQKMIPIAKGEKKSALLSGRILTSLFFEPSTRTRLSFETAMQRLGGGVVGISDPKGSSLTKGETLADTIRTCDMYSDVIVLRHPREGAARMAAEFSSKPVLNAGDGAGQHPTQTLLDLFTIKSELGSIQDVEIALVGDLKYGRTVHSLAYALGLFGAQITLVAPPQLQMPPEVINHLKNTGLAVRSVTSIKDVIPTADVLYVTRIQRERFPDEREFQKVATSYRVDLELLKEAKDNLIVMHPLPRVTEIATEVDSTKYACYFKQAFNGIPIRMAILSLVLGVLE